MEKALKLAIHMEPGKAVWLAYEKWIKKLAEMSDGRIKVSIVHSGYIGIEEWTMIKTGQSDIGRVFTLNMEPFPGYIVPALPFLLPNSPSALSIINSLYDRFLYLEWKEVKVLWLGLMSPYHLHTARIPVRTLEDFQGLKIQSWGLAADLVKAWGGTPISLIDHDGSARQNIQAVQYNALKTGIADGILSTFEVTNDFKLYEVTKYHTYLNVIRDVNATVMNLETWSNLPPDVQNIFEALNPWAQQELDSGQVTESKVAENILKKRGHTMIELPPAEYARWVNAAEALIEESLAKLDAEGIPATTMAQEIRRLASEFPE